MFRVVVARLLVRVMAVTQNLLVDSEVKGAVKLK